MTRLHRLLFAAVCCSASAAAQNKAAEPQPSLSQLLSQRTVQSPEPGCTSNDPAEVVVCGRSQQRYRIDPDVLEATRSAEAPPPKPVLDATKANACVGPDCGGGTIPLVAMALTAIKAAELAAEGHDWREAFRTHPDQYRAYQESKGQISVGVVAGNRQPPAGAGY